MAEMAELNGKTIEECTNRVLGYVTGSGIGWSDDFSRRSSRTLSRHGRCGAVDQPSAGRARGLESALGPGVAAHPGLRWTVTLRHRTQDVRFPGRICSGPIPEPVTYPSTRFV